MCNVREGSAERDLIKHVLSAVKASLTDHLLIQLRYDDTLQLQTMDPTETTGRRSNCLHMSITTITIKQFTYIQHNNHNHNHYI